MTTLFADHALLPSGWATDVRIGLSGGRISGVASGATPEPGDE